MASPAPTSTRASSWFRELTPSFGRSGGGGTRQCSARLVHGTPVPAELPGAVSQRGHLQAGSSQITWFDLHTTVAPPAPVANWSQIRDGKIVRVRATFDPRAIIAGQRS